MLQYYSKGADVLNELLATQPTGRWTGSKTTTRTVTAFSGQLIASWMI
jgi:hypothetical protein